MTSQTNSARPKHSTSWRRGLAVLLLAAFLGPLASAQDKPPAPAPAPDASSGPPEAADESASNAPTGDVIMLKSGHKIIGQVKGQSAGTYVVEVHPGVELDVPRDLVANVTYDNIDARQGMEGQGASNASESTNVIESSRISTELNRKLYKPLSEGKEPIVFPEHDLAGIMKDLAKRAGVAIDIDKAVTQLPPKKLAWDLKVSPDTTLFDLLHDDFSTHFPNLAVDYKYDRIVIHVAGQENAPAAPAPEKQ